MLSPLPMVPSTSDCVGCVRNGAGDSYGRGGSGGGILCGLRVEVADFVVSEGCGGAAVAACGVRVVNSWEVGRVPSGLDVLVVR